jgi:hypothetical protein
MTRVMLDAFLLENEIFIWRKPHGEEISERQKSLLQKWAQKSCDYEVWFDRSLLTPNVIELLYFSIAEWYMKKIHFDYLSEKCRLPADTLKSFLLGQWLFHGKPTTNAVVRRHWSTLNTSWRTIVADDNFDD